MHYREMTCLMSGALRPTSITSRVTGFPIAPSFKINLISFLDLRGGRYSEILM